MSDLGEYKNALLVLLVIGMVGLCNACGCSYQGSIPSRYNIMYHALESDHGRMICITKANLGNHAYQTRSEVYLHDNLFQPAEYPNLIIEDCGILPVNDIDFMTLTTNRGVLILHTVDGAVKIAKPAKGNLSIDARWFVDRDQMTSIDSGTVKKIPHLPGEFIGNSPDWKTLVTGGRDVLERDLHSLNLVDLETGSATELWFKRSRYEFLLNHAHGIVGIGSDNFWIAMQFRWDQSADGKYRLVYPQALSDAQSSQKAPAPALN